MKKLFAVIVLIGSWMTLVSAQAIVVPQNQPYIILLTEPQPVINAVQVQPNIFVPITPYCMAPLTFQPPPIYVAQPTSINRTIKAFSVIEEIKQEQRKQDQELIDLYLLLQSK